MIAHFPTNPTMNIGGMFTFQYIPTYLVYKLPAIKDKLVSLPVELIPGSTLLNGYSTLEEMEFKESQKDDENGPFFQWEINGFMPGDSSVLTALMEDMALVRHLLVITDNLGKQRLVGYNAPMTFSANFQSGGKPGEARGYKYAFTGTSPLRAPVYQLG